MTGRGGRGWFNYAVGGPRVDKSVDDAAAASSYDADANAYLQDVLGDLNRRDVAAIQRHVDTLKQAIEKDIEGETTLLFGGSVRKHTYVDGLSDIDILTVVNDSSLVNASPQQVLAYFEKRIADRLAGLGVRVRVGALAITVVYADRTEVQILPALRTPTGVRIAKPDGSGWSNVVRPQEFATKLTSVNQSLGRKVVPVIKLFKAAQEQLPATSRLTGYHIESLAIDAFRDYKGRVTYENMLQHLVQHAAGRVRTPILDTTGQSLHVDDYLGVTGSATRVRVSGSLDRLARRLQAAEDRSSIDDLKLIFGE